MFAECSLAASGRNRMSTEAAHFFAFGTKTEIEIQSTCSCSSSSDVVEYF